MLVLVLLSGGLPVNSKMVYCSCPYFQRRRAEIYLMPAKKNGRSLRLRKLSGRKEMTRSFRCGRNINPGKTGGTGASAWGG